MNRRKCWRCWLNSKRYKVVRFFQTLRLVLRYIPKDLYLWAKNYWLDKKWESRQPEGFGLVSNHCSSWVKYL